MNENDGSTTPDFDPDTAPDLSTDGWDGRRSSPKRPCVGAVLRRPGRRYPPPSGCRRMSSIILGLAGAVGRHGWITPCATGSSSTLVSEPPPQRRVAVTGSKASASTRWPPCRTTTAHTAPDNFRVGHKQPNTLWLTNGSPSGLDNLARTGGQSSPVAVLVRG